VAWGWNGNGQLGDGTTIDKSTPIQIGTASNWKAVSAGELFTIALKTDETLWAWGANGYGQLGNGSTNAIYEPNQIGTATDWKDFEAGDRYAIALKTDGSLWGWGFNFYGQLGDGTSRDKTRPIQIGTETNWKAIATGEFSTRALKTDGTLWAWGANDIGQLGDGTTSGKFIPNQIGTATNWKSISTGGQHTLALKTNGSLWAWGYNQYGQLGDGTTINKTEPIQIGTETNWKAISAEGYHTLAIKTDSSLWAWGRNEYGQLGSGTNPFITTPIRVGTSTNWKEAAVEFGYSIALKTDGSLWAWGYNAFGQLGDGTTTNKTLPTLIAPCNSSTGAIGYQVFLDNNNNCIFEKGDLALSGITVTLIPATGEPITTQVDINGKYMFTDLAAGIYQIRFPATTADGYVLKSINPITVVLTEGQQYMTADACYANLPLTGKIGGQLYHDLNGNNIFDNDDVNLGNRLVTLSDAAGNALSNQTSNSTGVYSFSNLATGTYKITFPDTASGGLKIKSANPLSVTITEGGQRTDANAVYVKVVTNKVFTDFPWLTTKLDTSQCTKDSIFVYQSGIFNYIFIKTATSGKLYFQDGTLYCTNSTGYDCVSAYQLKNPVSSWGCSRAIAIADNDKDGVLSNIDPDDNNPCVPNATASVCANKLFTDFTWITTKLDTSQCTKDSIFVYKSGVFNFIFIKTPTSGKLYFQDGTLYCTNSTGFDCVSAYQLKNPVSTWGCSRAVPIIDNDKDGVLSNTDPDDNNPCVPNAKSSICVNKLFTDFNWINTKLDTSQCTKDSIFVYQSGVFNYVFIKTATSGKLYFQDGTLYCTNSTGYDCVSAYQLKNPVSSWGCSRAVPIIDNDKDGTPADSDSDDNNPCVPKPTLTWTNFNSTNSTLPEGARNVEVDRLGNVWVGTFDNGLAKYNGSTWVTYPVENNTTRLGYNDVSSLKIDAQNNIWVSNIGGLYKFDGTQWTTYKFPSYLSISSSAMSLNTLFIDNQGNKWLGYDINYNDGTDIGLLKFDTQNNWTTYSQANSGLPNNKVRGISNDNQGNIWIGTDKGAAKYNGTTWTTYNKTNSGIVNDTIKTIATDAQGNIWFGARGGVSKLNGTTWTNYTKSNSGLAVDRIEHILIDPQGNKWFGTNGGGVSKFDGTTWTTFNTTNSGIIFNFIRHIAIDNQGDKWIVTGDGISKLKDCMGAPSVDKDKDGVLSNTDPDDNNPCVPNASASACSNKIFTDFPWLSTKVDVANCEIDSIFVYRSGIYNYIFIKTSPTAGKLYFQDGTLYCTNSPGFDCVSAYQFKEAVTKWGCEQNAIGLAAKPQQKVIANTVKNVEIQVYPNPSSGKVFVSLPEITGKILSVFNATGQLIQQIQLNDQSAKQLIELDLSDKAAGMYLIQWRDDKTILTKRLMLN
jgi:uncharacterized protein YaiE (UPF0345 family)